MTLFDAIGHSFSTIAIGGFSTHDASIGYFNSPTINTIIAIFLLISGCNYGLHFSLLSGKTYAFTGVTLNFVCLSAYRLHW